MGAYALGFVFEGTRRGALLLIDFGGYVLYLRKYIGSRGI